MFDRVSKSMLWVALACACLVAPSTAVFAQDAAVEETAESHIQRGVELRRTGDDAGALAEFEAALAIERTPRGLGQAGLACHALGRWVEAERYLEQAIAASTDPWVARNGTTLEQMRSEAALRLGSLEVLTNITSAEVRIDGRLVGITPFAEPLRWVAGTLQLEVTLEGHYPVSRVVVIPAGRLVRESIELAPLPPSAPTPEVTPTPTTPDVPRRERRPTPATIVAPVPVVEPTIVPVTLPSRPAPRVVPYIGILGVAGPTQFDWLLGGDARMSIPAAWLVPDTLAFIVEAQLGMMAANQYTPPTSTPTALRRPEGQLDFRAALDVGLRLEAGVFRGAFRMGFSEIVSRISPEGPTFYPSHAFQLGVDAGLGGSDASVMLSLDLLLTGDGWMLPLIGLGLWV